MEEAIAWSKRVGIEKLVLSLYPHNEAAIALYRSLAVDEGRLARTHASPTVTRTRYSWRSGSGARHDGGTTKAVNDRIVRIGLLGCGNVGAAVIRLLHEHAEDVCAEGRRPPRGRPGRRPQSRSQPSACRSGRSAHQRPGRRRRRPRHRPRGRGDRRHRAGPRADPRRAGERQAGGHGATRSCWPTSAPSCSPPPTTPGVDLLFEAAVAGGIPIVRPLRECLRRRAHRPRDRASSTARPTTSSRR